ncbi:hypothetical protein D3C87_1595490 [compost metagenome]
MRLQAELQLIEQGDMALFKSRPLNSTLKHATRPKTQLTQRYFAVMQGEPAYLQVYRGQVEVCLVGVQHGNTQELGDRLRFYRRSIEVFKGGRSVSI